MPRLSLEEMTGTIPLPSPPAADTAIHDVEIEHSEAAASDKDGCVGETSFNARTAGSTSVQALCGKPKTMTHSSAVSAASEGVDPADFWSEIIDAVRHDDQNLLANALSWACALEVRPGLVRIGFSSDERMARSQALRSQNELEAILTQKLGAPTTLSIENISPDAARGSLASKERSQREEREERQRGACQECEVVLLTQEILQGKIERIELFEAAEPKFESTEDFSDEALDP